MVGVLDAKSHAAGGGAVFLHEVRGVAIRFVVENEVDATLAEQRDIFRAMPGHGLEAEQVKHGLELPGIRGREFDEFEAIESHRVVKDIWHGYSKAFTVFDIVPN